MAGLKSRPEFLFVRQGVRANRPLVGVEARLRAPEAALRAPLIRFGLTASKKVGHAPARNRARRRLREAAKQLLKLYGVPGVDYVFVARPSTASAVWGRLLDDLRSALISVRGSLEGRQGRSSGADSPPRDEAG